MRLVVSLVVVFLTLLATASTVLAGAGPPADSGKLERKYAYTLALRPAAIREDAGQTGVIATVNLVRTFATDEVVTITVGKAHDNAKPGRDYTVSAEKLTVTIPAGQTGGTVAFQLTPMATGSQDPRRITVSGFGDRLLYMEAYITIEPTPPAATPTVGPAKESTRKVVPLTTPTPVPTPSQSQPPQPVQTAEPLKLASAHDSARSAGGPGGAGGPSSARHSGQGCTDEDREGVPRIRAANPTGPYCILHFDLDKPCFIMVHWEAQENGEYGHTVLYEGTQDVDFGDFHPQCTAHMYN